MRHFKLETREDPPPGDELARAIQAVGELRAAAGTFETRISEQLTTITARLDEAEVRGQRPGAGGRTEEPSAEVRAFADYLRFGDRSPEIRTLMVSNDPSGGYLAPKETSSEFIRDLVLYSPIRSLATVRQTAAPSVAYPKRTGITNARWKGEAQAQTGSEPTFGQAEVPVREVSTYVDISNSLLADSGGQAEAEVRLALADDFGVKEATSFVKGSGVLDPEGIMTNADVAYTPNTHATNLNSDALISLMYALPAAYRERGTWLMNGTTLARVMQLKDGQGNYLWSKSYVVGQPQTILGRPVVEAIDMDDVASGTFPILFGDIATGYRIVDRLDLSVLVNPYLNATNGVTRIHATRRVGGAVLQPKAIRKLKMSVS